MENILRINHGKFQFQVTCAIKNFLFETDQVQVVKQEESAGKCVFRLQNDEANLQGQLTFTESERAVWCRIFCRLNTEISYDRRNTFNWNDSVKICLTPLSAIDHAMGNYFFLHEKNDCWTKPFFTDNIINAPKRVASLLWKADDTYYHMLPLCQNDFKSEIGGNGTALEISCSPYTGGFTCISAASFVLAWGSDPFRLTEETAAEGFEALGLRRSLRKDKELPEIFRYLGWCSWDSFRTEVNAGGLLKKADEFSEKRIPVKWFLIDYGWYQEKDSRLMDFHEDQKKFPQGLKQLISELKRRYGLRWVGLWQCFLGDWLGIHPDSRIAQEAGRSVFKTNGGYVLPSVEEGGSFTFWNRWNEYIKNQGADFVKVDVQNSLEAFSYNSVSIGSAARGAHYGMEAAACLYFHGACINCTGMGTESIWNRPNGILNRNCSDFEANNVESMRQFAASNIYNSLYHSQFYYTDWDMMWSDGPTAKLNVVLHAVGGGPVYFSDKVGQSNPETILPFALENGELLKCDGFAMPTADRIFVDPMEAPLLAKAWNIAGNSGVLGVFNITSRAGKVTSGFSPSEIPGLTGEKFAVYNWYEKSLSVCGCHDRISAALEQFDAALFLISPISSGVAAIGAPDKYISCAAVKQRCDRKGKTVFFLKKVDQFAYYCSRPHQVLVNNEPVSPEKRDNYYVVACDPGCCTAVELIFREQM